MFCIKQKKKTQKTISSWLFPLRKVIVEVMKKYQVMLCLAIQVADTDGWQSRKWVNRNCPASLKILNKTKFDPVYPSLGFSGLSAFSLQGHFCINSLLSRDVAPRTSIPLSRWREEAQFIV